MPGPLRPSAVLFVLGLLAAVPQLAAVSAGAPLPASWPHERIELPRDDSVRFERLANGLGWAFMRNAEPANKISLRLYVDAGSMQETEAQRGIAHYLEHMAFNGSEHFPPGTVVERLQELGIAFGRSFNAHTGFSETVYKIDLPDTEPETLATTLRVLADTAGFLTLPQEEIDQERGVILAELRDRDTPGLRWFRKLYAALYPGLVLPQRFPIGTKEHIEAFDHAIMAAFYERWYRNDRLFLGVVGDVDHAVVAPLVREAFAKIPADAPVEEAFSLGSLAPAADLVVTVHQDEELQGSTLRYYVLRAQEPASDGAATRQRDLLRNLAAQILRRRFADIAESETAPILDGSAALYNGFDILHGYVSVTPKPGHVQEALNVLVRELRRFLQHGPTAAELDVVVKQTRSSLEQAVERAATRTNAALATRIYQSVRDDEVFTAPRQRLELYGPWLAAATPAAIQAAFAAGFSTDAPAVHRVLAVALREAVEADLAADLAARFRSLQDEAVAAPAEEEAAEWAYGEPPTMPAELGKERHVVAHEVVHLAYANEVRANLLARDAKPNEVLISLHLEADPRGFLPGRRFLAGNLLAGGLGQHDARELRRVLAGAKASVAGPAFETTSVRFSASCLPEELPLALQWLRAVLLDSAWRPEAFERAQLGWVRSLAGQQSDLDWNVGWHWDLLTAGGLAQRRGASLAEARAASLADTQAWLQPILLQAPLELAIVGDIDPERAESLVDTWFGSLPQRRPLPVVPDITDPTAQIAVPPLPVSEHRFSIAGSVDRSVIRLAWPTDDSADIHFRRRMGMLGQVIDEKLRKVIREDLGEAYSPFAGHRASLHYEGDGYLMVNVAVAPDKADSVLAAVRTMLAELLETGIDQELLDQVQVPAVKNLDQVRDSNGYWLGSVVGRSQHMPQSLVWADSIVEDYQAITAAELTALARRYLEAEPLVLIGTSRIEETADDAAAAAGEDEAAVQDGS